MSEEVVRALGGPAVAAGLVRLALAKKAFTAELNRLMFSVSLRRYLRVVRLLERVSPVIDTVIRWRV